ncbi:MAG: hypothetical protein GY858_08970, partial [Candidatus Omnitrophica bacterium]|nr:hypothetical protein [Candidatus Omnitrophota bacterium]
MSITQKMNSKDVVFILGAGASVPAGYPTGKKLREHIAELLQNRKAINMIAKAFGLMIDGGREEYLPVYIESVEKFIITFRDAIEPSIDKFLRKSPRLIDQGKMIISYIISKLESE